MSGNVLIKATAVSKSYKLYTHPMDRLKESVHPLRKKYHRDFNALTDVTFEIRKGETVSLIGRNGSGKSTLLKILSGVLAPTTGSVVINGRVSALLELGGGFNPEISGLENVYFNGMLQGYQREEMDQRLDSILSFADIGEFIHQPIKTYSSGMFARLAFAVAVNVDPDILIVDEALAVGDALTQKKCMDKMNDFRDQGKTILYVSHAIESASSFTKRGILLEKGEIRYDGTTEKTITEYLKLLFPNSAAPKPSFVNKVTASEDACNKNPPTSSIVPTEADVDTCYGRGGAEITLIELCDFVSDRTFYGKDTVRFRIYYQWDSELMEQFVNENNLDRNILFGMTIESASGIPITGFSTSFAGSPEVDVDPLSVSSAVFEFSIEFPELIGGDYFVTPGLSLGRQEKHIPLRRYRNLVRLKCLQRRPFISGVMALTVNFQRITR